MTSGRKIRPWMLAYAVSLTLLIVLIAIYGSHKNGHQRSMALEAFPSFSVLLLLAGSFLYALGFTTPFVRKAWKVAFPISLLGLIVGLVVSIMTEHNDRSTGPVVLCLSAITMTGLFF